MNKHERAHPTRDMRTLPPYRQGYYWYNVLIYSFFDHHVIDHKGLEEDSINPDYYNRHCLVYVEGLKSMEGHIAVQWRMMIQVRIFALNVDERVMTNYMLIIPCKGR